MVGNITSLTGKGLRDWMVQRISAVIIGLYFVFIIGFLLMHPTVSFNQWTGLFQQVWVRVFTALVLLALIGHAWVGLWTVTTDYIKQTSLRFFIQMVIAIILLALFIWGIAILWGS